MNLYLSKIFHCKVCLLLLFSSFFLIIITQWLQASLPIKDGGLWVRRVASLALPAFLASAAGTVSLQDAILARYACPTDSFFETFRQTRSDTFGTSPPAAADVMHKQSLWDSPGIQRDQTSGIWPGHLWASGQFRGCCCPTQWWLASCPAHHFMRFPFGWWIRLRSTCVRLWHSGWCLWHACLRLQTSAWPNRQTSGSERRRRKGICMGSQTPSH